MSMNEQCDMCNNPATRDCDGHKYCEDCFDAISPHGPCDLCQEQHAEVYVGFDAQFCNDCLPKVLAVGRVVHLMSKRQILENVDSGIKMIYAVGWSET